MEIITRAFLMKKSQYLRLKPTVAETAMCCILNDLNLPYKFQSPRWAKRNKRIFDFYIPYINLAVEVDGGYHDSSVDAQKDILLKMVRNFQTIRFKNEDVINNPSYVKKVLSEKVYHLAKGIQRSTSKRKNFILLKNFRVLDTLPTTPAGL